MKTYNFLISHRIKGSISFITGSAIVKKTKGPYRVKTDLWFSLGDEKNHTLLIRDVGNHADAVIKAIHKELSAMDIESVITFEITV